MAVVRTTASPAWFKKAAKAVKDHPKLERELLRAKARPGRTAELTAAEARILAAAMPRDARAVMMLTQIRASEAREAARHAALQEQLNRRRSG